MATLGDIERSTKFYADNRELLRLRVEALNDGLEALKREHLPDIKESAGKTANAKEVLRELIDENRHLFVKPRSLVISGIKVGLQKGKGCIIIEDVVRTIKLIHKHVPELEQDHYIETTEKIIKKNLGELDATTLKKVGVVIEGTVDVVLIKPIENDIDKLVNAILKDSTTEELANGEVG